MKEFKDSAIREMLRRRHAAVPPLSDDFEEKLFSAYEQRKKEQLALTSHTRVPHSRRHLILWPSIATAATVALLLTLHFTRQPVGESQMAQLPTSSVKDITAPIEKASPAPILSEASPKEGHKTCKRKNRVISQEEVTDNSIATASEEKTEEQHLTGTTRGTVALNGHLNDIRQKVRENVPAYDLAMDNIQKYYYD